MLVYEFSLHSNGGAEQQCRLQAFELLRRGQPCLVLSARTRGEMLRKEVEAGCEIRRLIIPQPWLESLFHFFRTHRSLNDNVKSAHVSVRNSTRRSRRDDLVAGMIRWCNTFCFIAGAIVFLSRNRNRIRLIHTHIADWNAGFAGWIGAKLGIPVVCKAAFQPPFASLGPSVPFAHLWRRWRKRISYIALTGEMSEAIAAQGVPEKRIHRIPNGVEIPLAEDFSSNENAVLFVGNFTQGNAHKGFDVLIRAWAYVHRLAPSALLTMAGDGDAEPWRNLAERLHCKSSIVFLGKVSDMATLYRTTAVFVLPSRMEGISNALLEAQSQGIPAVVSDIPGNREVVVDGQTGFIVPVDDPAMLAEKTVRLLQDSDLRRKMGRAAKKRMEERFSVEAVVDRICDLYAQLENGSA